jgi:chromosome segregation ATPase
MSEPTRYYPDEQGNMRALREGLGDVAPCGTYYTRADYDALRATCEEQAKQLGRIAAWVARESYGASLPANPVEAVILIAEERGGQVERQAARIKELEAKLSQYQSILKSQCELEESVEFYQQKCALQSKQIQELEESASREAEKLARAEEELDQLRERVERLVAYGTSLCYALNLNHEDDLVEAAKRVEGKYGNVVAISYMWLRQVLKEA